MIALLMLWIDCNSLTNVVRKLEVREIKLIAGDFNGHVEEGYEDQCVGSGYEISATAIMAVWNKRFRKSESHPVFYESGPSKT